MKKLNVIFNTMIQYLAKFDIAKSNECSLLFVRSYNCYIWYDNDVPQINLRYYFQLYNLLNHPIALFHIHIKIIYYWASFLHSGSLEISVEISEEIHVRFSKVMQARFSDEISGRVFDGIIWENSERIAKKHSKTIL